MTSCVLKSLTPVAGVVGDWPNERLACESSGDGVATGGAMARGSDPVAGGRGSNTGLGALGKPGVPPTAPGFGPWPIGLGGGLKLGLNEPFGAAGDGPWATMFGEFDVPGNWL